MFRRRFLTHASLTSLAVAVGYSDPSDAIGRGLTSDALLRIGQAYCAQFPALATEDALRPLVHVGADALRHAIQQDYADGNTVIVSGWVMSRTECQLCARAYRSQRSADVA